MQSHRAHEGLTRYSETTLYAARLYAKPYRITNMLIPNCSDNLDSSFDWLNTSMAPRKTIETLAAYQIR